jgi:hypothetical protein
VNIALEQRNSVTVTIEPNVEGGKIVELIGVVRFDEHRAFEMVNAEPSATISTPLTWHEVENGVRSDQFTILNLAQRLRSLRADPWADFFTTKQTISAAARRTLRA